MDNSVPGGCFIGRPANNADDQTQAAAAEPKPANTQTSRDFFVGTPEEKLPPQAATTTTATEQSQPAGELGRSISFMDCKSCGIRKEESRVPLTSHTGVNAHNMENKRNRRSDSPRKLPFELIKCFTNDFSEELGRGAFGQVFKGVLEDGEEVAVKMLHFMGNINDKQFENEFEILKRLQHPHIVRLVGFCDEAKEELLEYNGKLTVCQRIYRALCLEYMPNGSLGKLLSGENLGKDWPIRHEIIKGICWGLKYLQEGLEFPIFHLDLKPDNILLGELKIPKISDFGLSRLIGEENTKETLTPLGTIGYLPPEFINYQVISKEYDIYSLGVIITKIITGGITAYSDVADMGAEEFVEHVYDNWKKCLQDMPMYEILKEAYCKQVKRCSEIARSCMENDRRKRPTIKDIVSQLAEETDFFEVYVSHSASCGREPVRSKKQIMVAEAQAQSSLPVDASQIMVAEAQSSLPRRRQPSSLPRRREPVRSKKQISTTNMHKDPPSEIFYSTHPEHKLKLMTAAGTSFLCDGCKEPGYGPRYTCDCGRGGRSLDLHTRCALAGDPLFGLHTLVHPLFGYGKKFEFRFLHEPAPLFQEGRRVCDACGQATTGLIYHSLEEGINLHPCCASLPDCFLQDGHAFDLHRRASRPCALCPENEGRRRWFWAYRCYMDDAEEAAVDLHVACLKEKARRSWEVDYRNRSAAGDSALNVDSMLENKFGEIAGTVASFITALVFGKLIVKQGVAAFGGRHGF